MTKFVIKGEVASKKNNKQIVIRGSRPFLTTSQRYKDWHENAVTQLLMQKRGFSIECCKIVITFYYGTLRQKDADNGTSSIFDTLKDVGIIPDDNWQIIRQHFVFSAFDKTNPRAEIEIYDCNEEIHLDERINSVKVLKQNELNFD